MRFQLHRYENQVLILVLLVLLAQGMVRIAFVPRWMHYDEASHYEYMRYLVEEKKLPDPEHPNFNILNRVASTFEPNAVISPMCDQHGSGNCIQIGQQFGEVPGYYVLQALMQIIFHPKTIDSQIALARFVSVLLSIIVGWLGYAAAREVLPTRPLLAFAMPLTMSVLIGYVDLMSALNNDAGAVAALSLMVFAATRMIKYGTGWRTGTLVIAALAACLLTKITAWIGVPLAAFAALLGIWDHLPIVVRRAILVATVLITAGAIVWEPGVGLLLRPSINRLIPTGGVNARLRAWYMPASWPHYAAGVRWQFVTFWSGFATGVSGLPRGGIVVLSALSAAAIAGLLKGWRTSHLANWQWHILLFYMATIGLSLLMSVMRIDGPGGYMPTARHFYVAIIPTLLLLLIGLAAWVPPAWQRYALAGLILGFFIMNLWSLITVQIPVFGSDLPLLSQ
jgi:hypothetical protein